MVLLSRVSFSLPVHSLEESLFATRRQLSSIKYRSRCNGYKISGHLDFHLATSKLARQEQGTARELIINM